MSPGDELASLLGAHVVSTDPRELQRHARDLSARALLSGRAGKATGRPSCVVTPQGTEQVAEILSWAHDTRTPVVPYGGGSGVCEAVAPDGAVVVDLRRMDAVEGIDETSRLVTAQAGVRGSALDDAVRERGYMLGHEPQSAAISTVGGWIATRACGQLSARYGGIERVLAGLEAVLPGGRVVHARTTPRRATGPDVASLMIGSEGTLGIVTQATLRISRVPQTRADGCVSFDDMRAGIAACRRLAQSELAPTVVRLYDRSDSMLLLRGYPDPPTGPLLLMSFDGTDAHRRAERGVEVSGGDPERDDVVAYWWVHRNDAVEEYQRVMAGEGMLGPHGVVETMEVSATWSVIDDLYLSMTEALGADGDFVGCHLSHVYVDGACLYFTLAGASADDDAARDKHRRWWETGMRACLDAGGSISHHHGVGRLKAGWLAEELDGWYEVLRAVKRAIDPNGIMNPGALGL